MINTLELVILLVLVSIPVVVGAALYLVFKAGKRSGSRVRHELSTPRRP